MFCPQFPQYRIDFTDLATNAAVVIGAQTAAYPVVLLFIFLMVRTRSQQSFRESDSMELAGNAGAGIS